MKFNKVHGRKFCKSKVIMAGAQKGPLARIAFVAACIVFPFGLLFAFARQETPDTHLAVVFVKANAYRRAEMREELLAKGRGAVAEVLPLLTAPDVEAQLTALVVLERAKATEALGNIAAKLSDPNA